MELTFGTDIYCPICGKEIQYTTGFWKSLFVSYTLEIIYDKLNKQGGTLTSEICGHKWQVAPGSLTPAKQ